MDVVSERFPFDDRKECSMKGNYKSRRRALRNAKGDFFIVRTVNAKNVKSIEEDEGPTTEYLCPGVVYSMNRRERWDRLSANNVLRDAANKDISVGVLERWNTGKESDQLASAYHKVADGCITTRRAHRLAANTKTLVEKPRPKHRGSKAKRELAAKAVHGIADEQSEIPDVTYSISRAHPSVTKWKFVTNKGSKVTTKKRVKPLYDSVDEENEDVSESEVDEEINENDVQRERIHTCDISEFVRQPHSRAVLIETPSIESLESTVASCSLVAPFELVTFPKEVREESFALTMQVKLEKWLNFDFAKEAENLADSGQYSLTWLTRNEGCFAVDLTEAIIGHSQPVPHLTATFETPTDGSMSIRLNGSFSLEISREYVIAELLDSVPRSLDSMIASVISCATAWRDREFYRCLKRFAVPTLKRKDVIEISDPDPYNHMYQSETLLGTLNITSFDEMISAAREEHEASSKEENFEVIESEGKEKACSVCRIVPASGVCILYCLHSICIECLHESIVNQIRMGISPVKCHDENCDCSIPHDLIRMLLPIPLYVFYIKTVYKCIKNRKKEQVRSCPLCLEAGVVNAKPFHSLCCSACATCFCEECERIPHWPLTCRQFDEWAKKFEPQYQLELYRLDGKLKEYLVTRKCHCGVLSELPDNIGIAKCSACWLSYHWDTGKANQRWQCYFGKDENGIPIFKPPEAEMVSQRKAPTAVNRLYAPQCALARRKRFNEPDMKSVAAGLMHQPSSFRHFVTVTKIIDLRNTALHLLEYGTAWLFVNRMSPPENSKRIRNHLTKIFSKLDAVESRLTPRGDSDLRVQELTKAIDSLEATLAEIISLFELSI